MSASRTGRCALITTGGTIVSRIDPASGLAMPMLSGQDLLQALGAEAGDVEVHDFCRVASPQLGPQQWVGLQPLAQSLLEREDIAGLVVSHGTSTLEETAWFLDLTIASEKPVVLIGAQRNASEPDYDGPRNLLNAARVCVAPDAGGKGAMVVHNNQINAARDVTKSHTSDVEAFKSGDFGFLGAVDDDRVVFARAPLRRQHIPLVGDLPSVAIVPMYGGADGSMVRFVTSSGAKGIVVQALGWGNVSLPMYEAIREAIDAGVAVVISTRVPNGRVRPIYGFAGGGKTLKDIGAVFADNLSPQKARILLMLALQAQKSTASLQALFDR